MWNCPCCGDYRHDWEDHCYHDGTPRPPQPVPIVPALRTEIPKTEADWARDRHRRRAEAEKGKEAA